MAQILAVLLIASPIVSRAVSGGTREPAGSGRGSPRTLVSLRPSPIYSWRGWSIQIIMTTVKVSDVCVMCLWR